MDDLGEHERRRCRRRPVRFRAWRCDEDEEFEGVVTDLGAGGCFVESGEAVREGDLVKLRVETPGAVLTIWGDVVFLREGGFGVHFVALSHGGALEALLAEMDVGFVDEARSGAF